MFSTVFPRAWNLDPLGLRQSLFRRLLLNIHSVTCLGFCVKSLETINTLTNITVLQQWVLKDLMEKGTQEVLDKAKGRNDLKEIEIEKRKYIYIYPLTFIKLFLCCLFSVL